MSIWTERELSNIVGLPPNGDVSNVDVVYLTRSGTGRATTTYHPDPDCFCLNEVDNPRSWTREYAERHGKDECGHCGDSND